MQELDKTDYILIGIALLALLVQIVYSRYRKLGDVDTTRHTELEQPIIWSATRPADREDKKQE